MLEIKNQLIAPQNLMDKIRDEVSQLAHESSMDVTGIEAAISKIQTHLQPKRSLPAPLKQRFFMFRIRLVERIILKIYNLLMQEQREATYHLTLVCQTLLHSHISTPPKSDQS